MSAVAAILSLDGSPVAREECEPMAGKLAEFGQDRQWRWEGPKVVLLRALNALTPSDAHATAIAAAGDWMLVGDVRLDARDDLVRSLGLEIRQAGVLADEQLFALALEKWGAAAPDRIHGGFAVIAWERSRRRLHLWQDTIGERSLCFHRSSRRLAIASRAPVLLVLPHVPHEVDLRGMIGSIAFRRPPFLSPLKGIETLQAGTHHIFHESGLHESRPYWQPPDLWEWTRETVSTPVEKFREVFRMAVADRLRTLGVKGGFCSGGLDSPSITAMAADCLSERGEPFFSFTSVPHPDWQEPPSGSRWENDERPYVEALVRRHPNITPAFVAMESGISLDCLATRFRATAAPTYGFNLTWGQAIQERMREHDLRIPFVGGGGNATISLDSDILWDLLRAGRLDLLAGEFRASPRQFARSCRAILGTLKASVRPSPSHLRHLPIWLAKDLLDSFAKRLPAPQPPSLARSRQRFAEIHAAMQVANYGGMGRLDPTRDRRLVELCRRLPPQEFRHGNERRRLVRRTMEGLLPDKIRLRSTRGAQSPDYWLRVSGRKSDLREAMEFVGDDALASTVVNMDALRKCLADWPDRYDPAFVDRLRTFEVTLSVGLYLRWTHDRLDALPGTRPLRSLLVEPSAAMRP